MFTIAKRYDFSAAHHLLGLPLDHPCSRNHGHNYQVEFELAAEELDGRSFVLDYNELDQFVKPIIARLDHQDLNQIIVQPSAENLATWLYHTAINAGLPYLRAVRVRETAKTVAECRP